MSVLYVGPGYLSFRKLRRVASDSVLRRGEIRPSYQHAGTGGRQIASSRPRKGITVCGRGRDARWQRASECPIGWKVTRRLLAERHSQIEREICGRSNLPLRATGDLGLFPPAPYKFSYPPQPPPTVSPSTTPQTQTQCSSPKALSSTSLPCCIFINSHTLLFVPPRRSTCRTRHQYQPTSSLSPASPPPSLHYHKSSPWPTCRYTLHPIYPHMQQRAKPRCVQINHSSPI